MNLHRILGDDLSDRALRLALEVVEPLTRSRIGTDVLEAGITAEALARRARRGVMQTVAAPFVDSTAEGRRRARELAARAELAPDRPVDDRSMPAVFWHGPDHVDPARPVLVLVNGWTASGIVWPRALVSLLEERFQVIRVDNRGAGWSRTAPAPFTMARMADDVADVLCWVGASSATVLGLSMGGMISQELAMRHPSLVERLVLCGTKPPSPAGFMPHGPASDVLSSTPERGETLRDFLVRAWSAATGPGFASSHPDLLEEMVMAIARRPTPQWSVLTQARAIAAWFGSERLTTISAPTTVIHGTHDPLIAVGNGMRLAQLIPDATYVELPGVGHLVPYEAPDAIVRALEQPAPVTRAKRR